MTKYKAVTLDSSGEILFSGAEGFKLEETALVALLSEAYEKGLASKVKINTSEEYLPEHFFWDFIYEEDLEVKTIVRTYEELDCMYSELDGTDGRNYSPEVEEKRFSYRMENFRRGAEQRSAWIPFIQQEHIKKVKRFEALEAEEKKLEKSPITNQSSLKKIKKKKGNIELGNESVYIG